jgi:zinc protease
VIKYLSWLVMILLSDGALAGMAEFTHRSKIAGIDVITYNSNIKDVVVILGSMPAGDAMAESGNAAIPTLVGMMLDRGTTLHDKFSIAQMLEDVGATISFNVGSQTLELSAKCLTKDLPLVLGLIAEELRTPKFQPEEFAKAKQQLIGSLQAASQNTESRAKEIFSRTIFPPNHPNYPHSTAEFLAAAKSATLNDLKLFHGKYYGPKFMVLVLAGDVPNSSAEAQISKEFAGWTGGHDYLHAAVKAEEGGAAGTLTIPLADKPSVSVILGQPTGLQYRDADALALRVGTAILGRGFTGRLMGIVRDKEGLTYDIGALVSEDNITDGAWDISASFAPALLDKGIASTRRELNHWWQDGVTQSELDERKQGLIGSYRVGLSNTGGIAFMLLTTVQRGHEVGWLDEYPQAIQALTLDQVNRAIKTHLDPSRMILVEAGSVAAASLAR